MLTQRLLEIVDALGQTSCPKGDVVLSCLTAPFRDQDSQSPQNLLRSEDGKIDEIDSFSSSVRQFSQHLRSFRLRDVVVGNQIFWPTADLSNPTPPLAVPHWKHLEIIHIIYRIATTDGIWLFGKEPGTNPPLGRVEDGSWDMDRRVCIFRHKAEPQINEFYAAAARAATEMPRLQEMYLEASDAKCHGFEYRYKDTASTGGKVGKATMRWGSVPGFTPEEYVVDSWKKAILCYHSCEVEVLIDDTKIMTRGWDADTTMMDW